MTSLTAIGCGPSVEETDASMADAGARIDAFVPADADVGVDAFRPEDGGTADASTPTEGEILTADYAPYDLALGGGYVYFTEADAVRRVPVGGGAVEEMFRTGSPSVATRGIGADADRFAWTHRDAMSLVNGAVQACPHAGCGASPETFSANESTNRIDVDGTVVAWTSPSIMNLQGVTGTMGWSVPTNSAAPLDVDVDGNDVFWITAGIVGPEAAFACDASGGTCTPAMISDAVGAPLRIAVAGEHVVVLSDTGLFHMGRDGSGASRLADGVSPGGDANDLTTDGVDVYWSTRGQLYGCAIAACTPTLVAMASGQVSAGLAVDDTNIYWATADPFHRTGAIRRVAR